MIATRSQRGTLPQGRMGRVRSRLQALALGFFVSIAASALAADRTRVVTYTFDAPAVGADESASSVSLKGCASAQHAGRPKVPFRTGRILLPPAAQVEAVAVEAVGDALEIPVSKPLAFGRTPVPIGRPDHPSVAKAAQDRADPLIYGVDTPYPENRVRLVSVQRMCGYSVAIVQLFPVQYYPVSGKLVFCPKMKVSLTLGSAQTSARSLSARRATSPSGRRVQDFVDNSDAMTEYVTAAALGATAASTTFDYLLVTKAALTNAFRPLVEQKVADGLSVKVATVEDVVASCAGVDDAAKLRAYITYAYTNWNTQYVLLGGDIATVPYRKAYAYCDGADTNMPCDLYFACLDGSWNSDGDGYWGEPTDGEGGGDVDLLAEVYVGRAPVDTSSEVSNFVAKTVRYEQSGHANAGKARFLGEYLGNYSGTYSQGGDGLDPLLPAFSDYQVEWLDDRPTNGDTWGASDCVNALNQSPHLVAHDGHANETYALRMYESSIDSLTNAEPFLLDSVGCYCGAFDYSDCFAEELVKRNRHGAFAVVMNSRYGWFDSDYEWMFSGEFMGHFFDELLTQGHPNIGAANQLSKHDMIGSVETSGDMVYRWCYFEITLFGDPHVALQGWDGFQVAPADPFEVRGSAGGPFAPTGAVYQVSNVGDGAVSWSLAHAPDWLSVTPVSGTLAAGTTGAVQVAVGAQAAALAPGDYADTLVFSNAVSGNVKVRTVRATVLGDFRFGAASYACTEAGGAQVAVAVERTAHTNLSATVDFAATPGTATAGSDFVATNGTLTFAAGETRKTFAVEIVDDVVMEPAETVLLALSNPTGGATLGAPVAAELTIADEDTAVGQQLGTTFNGGNSAYGNMFDLVPKKNVSIEAFDVNMAAVTGLTGSVTIYYRSGGSFGYETNSAAWTLLTTKTVTSDGPGLPTRIDLGGNGLAFAAGQRYGLYVHCDSGLTYTTGSNTYEDASVQLVANCGKGSPAFTGGTYAPRIWNGRIAYLPLTSDKFYLCPEGEMGAVGYEGGPFAPWYKAYMLTNASLTDLTWTSRAPSWLTVSPASGTLAAGAAAMALVSVSAGAAALPAGAYAGAVVFSNTVSGCTLSRGVALTVLAAPGAVAVSDSIAPSDDLSMPFGPVIAGLSRTERITVSNLDAQHSLVVSGVSSCDYRENFSDGLARGWEPRVPSYWSVAGGEYVVQGYGFMLSSYGGRQWGDVAAQVSTRCAGTAGYTSALFFRATDDFDADATGSAYGVGISSGYFWVAKWVDGAFSFLTGGWAESPYLYADGETNWVAVCAHANAITVYFNGHKAWEGADASIAGAGRIVLGGYSEGATVHRFDNVEVGDSVDGESASVTSVASGAAASGQAADTWCAPAGFTERVAAAPVRTASAGVRVTGAFGLADLPSLPVTVSPGGSLTFSVVFAPSKTGSHAGQVVIESSDADEPEVAVELSGEGMADYLSVSPESGFGGSGHPGGPFAPPSHVYVVSNNSAVGIGWAAASYPAWVSVSPASGALAAGASAPVAVAFNASAAALGEGSYGGSLVFSNTTTSVVHARPLALDVFTSPTVLVAPPRLAVTNRMGQVQVRNLQIGNAAWADASLDFSLGVSETNRTVRSATLASSVKRDFTQLAQGVTYAAGELLVRFSDEVPQAGASQAQVLANAGGGAVARRFKLVPGLTVVKLPEGLAMGDALVRYNRTAGIRYAQPNYRQHALRTPNDPYFSALWGLNNTAQTGGKADVDIDAPEAWERGVGGAAVTVAVIDTGIDYTHEDLAANLWRNPGEIAGNGIDDDGNGYVDDVYGYDFCNGDADPMDDNGHGTHCSGTIGAVGDNGVGVAGVCWTVKLMALKFLDASGSGSTADAIGCIEYAVQKGARVLSNSWGGGGYEQALKDAIDAAGAAGALFVAAAGNDYGNNNDATPAYPASYESDNIVSVMSVEASGVMSSFSNYGATSVDIAAPGTSILSCQPGGGYQYMSGTSMATPHVSGACALLLSLNSGLSSQQVKAALLASADASLPGLCVAGGLLRLDGALAYVPAWLRAAPVSGSGLAPGALSNVVVTADAGALAAGTYEGIVRIASNDRSSPVTNVPVSMVVLGDDLAVLPSDVWVAEGFTGGPFSPNAKVYTLTNAGVSSLSWSAGGAGTAWVSATPGSGVLAAGQAVQVTALLNAQAAALASGDYEGQIVFSNATSAAMQVRKLSLSVRARVFDHFDWQGVSATQHVARPFGVTVRAIDNAGSVYPGFAGRASLYAASVAATERDVVSGTNVWNYPMSTYYHDARTQVIYLKDEVGGAGLLTGLSLYVVQAPGQTMHAWTIRLMHTSLSSYGGCAWQTNGWTVVAQTNLTVSETGWVTFDFAAPFLYNGADNLLVDFSFNNSSWSSDGYCWCLATAANRSLCYRTDSLYGDPLDWTGASPYGDLSADVPVIRLEKHAAFPLAPSETGAFIAGLWSGSLSLSELATNIVLVASDGNGHAGASAPFDVVITLAEALDNEVPAWATGGSAAWFGQRSVSHDAVDAARSGPVGNRQSSWLSASAAGPCEVAFWWRVSSEADWDWLEFYVDDALTDRISGESGWLYQKRSLAAGLHTLKWRFVKDAADLDPVGQDCGWVDQFIGPVSSVALAEWLRDYGLPFDGSGDYADADGDGLNNWAEWVAGTVPTNRLSVLQVVDAAPESGGDGFRVRWQSVAGKSYWVESCERLGPSAVFTPFVSNVLGQAGSTEVIDLRPSAGGARFYRVGVQP